MVKQIPLTGEYGKGLFALVSDCDFEWLSISSWHVSRDGYARGRRGDEQVLMHRFIMGDDIPRNMRVDHKNMNRLDNRRENLRISTPSENKLNMNARQDSASGVKGVHLLRGRYRVAISIDGERVFIGSFVTIRSAAIAYNEAALKHHGEFARTNDLSNLPPDEDPPSDGPSSPYRGVHWDKSRQKWCARIKIDYDDYPLGRFDAELQAAEAYNAAAALMLGPLAKLNDLSKHVESDIYVVPKPPTTSNHPGVHYDASGNRWRARVTIAGKRLHLGSFKTEAEAIAARKAAESIANSR